MVYNIDKATRIVTIHYSGSPEFVEFKKTMEAVFVDPDYETGFKFLLDRSHVDETLSSGYIRNIADFLMKNQIKLNCVAFLVPDPVTHGMIRMAQLLSWDANIDFHVFSEMEEARRWSLSHENPK